MLYFVPFAVTYSLVANILKNQQYWISSRIMQVSFFSLNMILIFTVKLSHSIGFEDILQKWLGKFNITIKLKILYSFLIGIFKTDHGPI